jgi:hypothetical protein
MGGLRRNRGFLVRGRSGGRAAGFLAMSGQIIDATIVAAPKQRNMIEEKKRSRKTGSPTIGRTSPPSSRDGISMGARREVLAAVAYRYRAAGRPTREGTHPRRADGDDGMASQTCCAGALAACGFFAGRDPSLLLVVSRTNRVNLCAITQDFHPRARRPAS